MYNHQLHTLIDNKLKESSIAFTTKDAPFYARLMMNLSAITALYNELYGNIENTDNHFHQLIDTIIRAYKNRTTTLKKKDEEKLKKGKWFLSNHLAGMSLYVDRFCGNLQNLQGKMDYFSELGVNVLHLMPLFESPEGESDGGYAVSDFRKIDSRFGNLDDMKKLQKLMHDNNMYLMIDIVLNHTSHKHEWAKRAIQGDKTYQDYYYMYDDRTLPNTFETTMPEIFPESSPGNFTYNAELKKWVMTVFHNYQWDLNYTNPAVLNAMLDNIFFYANLGVDILRIDAPAFIWKQTGTTCQNLPQAHQLLQLIKQCVEAATPGMALLGEAIVAPDAIMEYFGKGLYTTQECDFAYNATQMALQWDALATGDTRVMLAAQPVLGRKPRGASWITYTRCHDDIGLGFDDYMIEMAGFNPYHHRQFLKNYYSGNYTGSPSKGALFSSNPKTGDARISGSLASLCGLEKALENKDQIQINISVQKILLMQAMSFFIGGLPMLFYGDEAGYTNDYTYLKDSGKYYDNRWMHRPIIDWNKNEKIHQSGSVEQRIFSETKKLLKIRTELKCFSDQSNIRWMSSHNIHVAGFVRKFENESIYCLFNFYKNTTELKWAALKEIGLNNSVLKDHYSKKILFVGGENETIKLHPYTFMVLEPEKHE